MVLILGDPVGVLGSLVSRMMVWLWNRWWDAITLLGMWLILGSVARTVIGVQVTESCYNTLKRVW
jgi:hypothetical protein